MDHRAFQFATRGQCIKGKHASTLQLKPKYVFVSKQSSFFPFMHCLLAAN